MIATPTRVRYLSCALLVAGMALTAPAAHAEDGVAEIHQSCVATGCLAGDPPGFPVLLTRSGSYRLTSDLQVPDASTTAIEVAGTDISIDLNGFAILGITVCSGTPNTCSPTGIGNGIGGPPLGGDERTRVFNGHVRGMGSFGISLGGHSSVESVTSTHNGGVGIAIAFGGNVRDSRAMRNGSGGINIGSGVVSRCLAYDNQGTGISIGSGSVTHSSARRNGLWGIALGSGGLALGNSATNNTSQGLSAPTNSAYGENLLHGNADGTPANQVGGGGIQLGVNVCAGVPCP